MGVVIFEVGSRTGSPNAAASARTGAASSVSSSLPPGLDGRTQTLHGKHWGLGGPERRSGFLLLLRAFVRLMVWSGVARSGSREGFGSGDQFRAQERAQCGQTRLLRGQGRSPAPTLAVGPATIQEPACCVSGSGLQASDHRWRNSTSDWHGRHQGVGLRPARAAARAAKQLCCSPPMESVRAARLEMTSVPGAGKAYRYT